MKTVLKCMNNMENQIKIYMYNSVKVEDDDVIKYDYNVLQEI